MSGFIEDACVWEGGRVSDRVRCVRANNPSPMTYVGTNSWIVHEPGSASCVVIDPSPANDQTQAILKACEEDGLTVGAIFVTHDHHDHTEGAKELSRITNAPVYAKKPEIAADTPDGALQASFVFSEGALCPFEGAPVFQVINAPGHSADSVALHLPIEKAIFVGDVVFRHGPTVVFYPEGNLADYLASLDVLSEYVKSGKAEIFYPGHGWPIDDPIRALNATKDHRIERLDQVRAALASGVAPDADALFDAVYVGVDERLRWASLRSIEAQLEYLKQVGESA